MCLSAKKIIIGLGIVLLTTLSCSTLVLPEYTPPSAYRSPTSTNESQFVREEFSLIWPTRGARLSRGYQPAVFGRSHLGLDLAAPRGTPIYAAHAGRVIYTGSGFSGYGKFVIVEFNDEWATFYSHLDQITVKQGAWINQGTVIGKMGRTGNASGVHLHFELRQNRQAIDPLNHLPEQGSLAFKE